MTSRILHAGHNPDYHHSITLRAFTCVTTNQTRAGRQFHAYWGSTHLHLDHDDAQALYERLGVALGYIAPLISTVAVRPPVVPAADGHCHMTSDVGDRSASELPSVPDDAAGAGHPNVERYPS